MKQKLKGNGEIAKKGFFLVETSAHDRSGHNQITLIFMACVRYVQHACLLSYQKTPVALRLIFNILFNCSPLKNFVVSPTTLSDWNVLLGEAYKLILRKRFSNSNYDFHLWSNDYHKGGKKRHIVGVYTWCPIESKPRANVLKNSLIVSGSCKNEYDITNLSGLVGDSSSTQKGTVDSVLAKKRQKFWKGDVFCRMLPTCTKHYAEKNVPGWVWGQG